MVYDVKYVLFNDGTGFYADISGHHVGQITFVRSGGDKMIIDHTEVEEPYRDSQVGFGLVAAVVNMARTQKRKIVPLCPFAASMFIRHPEFADVRLMNAR